MTITLNVYLQNNCFKFCINDKYVEFENIINTLKNISSLNDKKNCTLKNPIYTFEIKIEENGSDNSGFTLELSLTMTNGNDIDTTTSEPIKIQVVSKNEENHFVIKDKKISCSDIIAQLLKLIDGRTVEQGREFFKDLLLSINIQDIIKKTTGYVKTNLEKTVGQNPSYNIDALKSLNDIKQILPAQTKETDEFATIIKGSSKTPEEISKEFNKLVNTNTVQKLS